VKTLLRIFEGHSMQQIVKKIKVIVIEFRRIEPSGSIVGGLRTPQWDYLHVSCAYDAHA
jgi:hypothetical protein